MLAYIGLLTYTNYQKDFFRNALIEILKCKGQTTYAKLQAALNKFTSPLWKIQA